MADHGPNASREPRRRAHRVTVAALAMLAAIIGIATVHPGPVLGLFTSTGTQTHNPTALSPYSRAVLNDNPIGYWPLDETSGTIAYDKTSGARNGTYVTDATGSATSGGAPMPVNAGGSAEFNLGQVTFPALPLPTAAGAKVTVDFWMLIPSGAIASMPFTFGSNGVDLLYEPTSNKFGFNTFSADNWGVTPATNLVGRPVHVTAVFVNEPATVADFQTGHKLYIDGVQQSLVQNGTPALKALSPNAVASGNIGVTNWRLSSGSRMSDVAVYSGELSPAQVANHFLAGHIYSSVVGQTPGLLNYWRLGEPSGATAWEYSGRDQHGTYTNDAVGTVTYGGAAMTRGSAGSAVFNGGTVTLPNIAVPQIAGAVVTVEFWMYVPSEPTVVTILFAFQGHYVQIDPTTHGIGFGTANSDMWYAPDSGLFGRTVYVTAVLKNWSDTADFQSSHKICIDGMLQTPMTQSGTPATKGLSPKGAVSGYVGQNSGTAYRLTSGSRVSDVAVYNGELDAATIQNHYLNGKP